MRTVGGRVLIVLTDGKDVSSKRVARRRDRSGARTPGVAVYPIAIAGAGVHAEAAAGSLPPRPAACFYRASDSGALARRLLAIA